MSRTPRPHTWAAIRILACILSVIIIVNGFSFFSLERTTREVQPDGNVLVTVWVLPLYDKIVMGFQMTLAVVTLVFFIGTFVWQQRKRHVKESQQ